VVGEGAVIVRWQLGEGGVLMLAANLAATPAPGFPSGSGRELWQEGEAGADGTFGPWSIRWSIDEDPRGRRGNDTSDKLAERRGIEPQFRHAKGAIAHTDAATKRRPRPRQRRGVGLSDERLNWCRRVSMTLEELANRPRFIDIAEIFRAERGTGNSGKTNEPV
jgi:Domain of unknown function (DUF3459)